MSSAEYLKGLFGMDGQVAVVIGGAGRLGLCLATGLGKAGAKIVVADMNEEACQKATAQLKADGIEAVYALVNVTSKESLRALLAEALKLALAAGRPAAVRYPRGALMDMPLDIPLERGKWALMRPLRPVTVVAVGRMVQTALEAAQGLDAGLVNARCISPLDTSVLEAIRSECRCVITIEDGIRKGAWAAEFARLFRAVGRRLCAWA